MEKTLIQLLEKAKKFHLSGKLSEAQKIYLNLIKKKQKQWTVIFFTWNLFFAKQKI